MPASAETFNVTNQTDFANAVAVATANGQANTITITSPGVLPVHANGSVVNFPGTGPSLDLNVVDQAWFVVGNATTGLQTLNIGAGTTITLLPEASATRFQIGAGGVGAVYMTGGNIFVDQSGVTSGWATLDVGRHSGGDGVFHQSGGAIDLSGGAFQVGYEGGVGVYNLSGGTFELGTGSTVYIGTADGAGLSGTGTFNITGTGSFTQIGAQFYVANGAGSVGTITQDGAGTNVLIHTNNAVLFGSAVAGATSGGTATYNLVEGTFEVRSHNGVTFGGAAGSIGTFNQSGGTFKTTGTNTTPLTIGGSGLAPPITACAACSK